MSYRADLRETGRHNRAFQDAERGSPLDARLLSFLERLCAGSFFGKVVVSFQNGKIVDVRTEQTRKLEEL